MTIATPTKQPLATAETPSKLVANELVGLKVQEDKQVKKGDEQEEPLLTPNPRRFVLFPIKYHDVSFYFYLLCIVPISYIF